MTETVIPSMNFRFALREKTVGVGHGSRYEKILQQSFTTSKGQEWRDVPFVDEVLPPMRKAKADERGEISDSLRELMFTMENGNDRALLDDFIESLASAM